MSKKNIPHNVDTPSMEEMRAKVVEQELSARSWKAYYEKMYYSMEAEKIEPAYREYQQRMAERLEKEKKEYEEFLAKMKEQLAAVNKDSLGTLNIDEKQPEPVEAPVVQM